MLDMAQIDLFTERTARRLAAAFSPGQPWTTLPTFHDDSTNRDRSTDDERVEGTDGLSVARRTRTLERAGQLVHAEQECHDEEWLQVEVWEAKQTKQDGTRVDRVRELVEWKALRSKRGGNLSATPSAWMDTTLLGAMSFADLDKPRQEAVRHILEETDILVAAANEVLARPANS